MHELGIARALVTTARREARREGAARVLRVTVTLGALSGVVAHALRTCFPVAARGTPLDEAALHIVEVPGRGFCASCDAEFAMDELLGRCPGCGGFASEVRGGDDISLTAIDVELGSARILPIPRTRRHV